MSHTLTRFRRFSALLLCLAATDALAGDDWLITRVNGRWTWERSGPEGRVQKKFLNQEVLRLGEKGEVDVLSLQPIQPGKVVQCSESARRNPQEACSSAFLDCKPTGGGTWSSLLGLVTNGAKGIAEARNAYRCQVNEDAVLEAANEVGLIEGIPPKTREKPPTTEEAPGSKAHPSHSTPYGP